MTIERELFPNARTVLRDEDRLLGIGPVFGRIGTFSYYICTTAGDILRIDEQKDDINNQFADPSRTRIEQHRATLSNYGNTDHLIAVDTEGSFKALVQLIREQNKDAGSC